MPFQKSEATLVLSILKVTCHRGGDTAEQQSIFPAEDSSAPQHYQQQQKSLFVFFLSANISLRVKKGTPSKKSHFLSYKNSEKGLEKWFSGWAHIVLAEELRWIPSTQVGQLTSACNSSSREPDVSSGFSQPCMCMAYIHKNAYIFA